MQSAVCTRTFTRVPEASRLARHWVSEEARRIGWVGSVGDLELLVSELVTNGVRYTGDGLGVTVYVHRCAIWVSVSDDGAGTVTMRDPTPSEPGGRGLQIVERICGSWGVAVGRSGKSVWFELANATADART